MLTAKLLAAASRMLDILSSSNLTHIGDKLSPTKFLPSCFARRGTCWRITSRTLKQKIMRRHSKLDQQRKKSYLHLESSANSNIAGSKDWDRRSIPITSFNADKVDIKFNRTSDAESRRSEKRWGSNNDIVFSFPSSGARYVATDARAARTCSLSSSDNAITNLTSLSEMLPRSFNSSFIVTVTLHFATPARLNAAAVRTFVKSNHCKNKNNKM